MGDAATLRRRMRLHTTTKFFFPTMSLDSSQRFGLT